MFVVLCLAVLWLLVRLCGLCLVCCIVVCLRICVFYVCIGVCCAVLCVSYVLR